MTKPEYSSLHAHFHQSVLDGFSTVDEYLEAAAAQGMRGHGSSDHGNVYNAYEFITKARAAGITPVPGCEMYLAPINPDGAKVKDPVFYGKNGQKAANYDVSSNGAYLHLTVWAVNNQGLNNLFQLSSKSFAPENTYFKNRIDFEMLSEHSEGLVVATGCPSSEISTRFLLGQDKKAYEYAGRLKEVFGDNLFVEVMNHNMKDPLERILLPKQVKLSKDLGIPLLATNDTHYAVPGDAPHHEEFLCMQSGSTMNQAPMHNGGPRFAFDGAEYYVKSAAEMAELFPEADYPGALKNSLLITEMATDLTLDFDPRLRPKATIPAGFSDEISYFKHLINEGYKKRYGNATQEVKDAALKGIAYEYDVFYSSDYVGYLLTVREYLNWTRETYSTRDHEDTILALSVGPGRGSVGGSIIAYLLEISEVDPIRFDLVFERFLSPGRGATYRITYDDGTYEDKVVSEKAKIISGNDVAESYIYQLQVGDEIIIEENAEESQ